MYFVIHKYDCNNEKVFTMYTSDHGLLEEAEQLEEDEYLHVFDKYRYLYTIKRNVGIHIKEECHDYTIQE